MTERIASKILIPKIEELICDEINFCTDRGDSDKLILEENMQDSL